jgi:hypothetical protein
VMWVGLYENPTKPKKKCTERNRPCLVWGPWSLVIKI